MRTKKVKRTNLKRSRKKGGSNDDIPCGINSKGENIKCPPNHRCETMENGQKLCKKSVDITLEHNGDTFVMQVPWKRHEKWLSYSNILNKNISVIRELLGNKEMKIQTLKDINAKLKEQIINKELLAPLKSANNKEELVIQNVLLNNIIENEKQNDKNSASSENITQEKETNDAKYEEKESDIVEEEKINPPIEIDVETAENMSLRELLETPNLTIVDNAVSEEKSPDITPEEQYYKNKINELQENIKPFPGEENLKEYNKYLFETEKTHHDFLKNGETSFDFLYPEHDDPNFNVKIAQRKEFFDTQYDGTIYDVKTHSEKMCNADFELMPHQLFVKNFMSLQTPYNSLLLFHGLGTGKTCSAIGIAEEMRSFIKNVGSTYKIIIVASPNVQNNFKLQLFDERKLRLESGVWNLNTCVGNELLKELNPAQLQDVPKSKVITQINSLINQYYTFKGYGEFANYIKKKTMVSDEMNLNPKDKKIAEINNIKQYFNNRLIIIDEVHNISSVQANKENKKTSYILKYVCKYADNIRLLLLSATPMYNSYREIIWITNLLNIVDKRSEIREEDVFDKDGNFIEQKTTSDGLIIEGGKELLRRKLTGYVSYVRGENPYTFPYRIYPDLFDPSRILENYPTIQMNNKPIETPLKHTPLYMNNFGSYQQTVYKFIMNHLKNKTFNTGFNNLEEKNLPNFENMESFGYTLLTSPIQSLNIVYPNKDFDKIKTTLFNENRELDIENNEKSDSFDNQTLQGSLESDENDENRELEESNDQSSPENDENRELEESNEEKSSENDENVEQGSQNNENNLQLGGEDTNSDDLSEENNSTSIEEVNMVSEDDEINLENSEILINSMLGSQGLSNIMTYEKINSPYMLRYNFQYKPEAEEEFGRLFSQNEIGKYSGKIENICNIIQKSKGIIMIYSQYLDSGIVPIALALEELGFSRFGTASHTKSLFKKPPTKLIDAITMKPKDQLDESQTFTPAKYAMITGDKYFSPNNSADLKYITSQLNKNGEKIKVVLITKAAAEGLDFKNIRQLHILEPWYNSSRTEQIIGRCVRNLSHCDLPFEDRNVEIYLHATLPADEKETTDLYVYRYAEKKAIQIGLVTRLLKESAVDCILNIGQTNLTLEKLTAQANGQDLEISTSSQNNQTIKYQIGDKPFTALCDYMDTCNYTCNPDLDLNNVNLFKNTYNEQFAKMNYPHIIKRIRQIMKEQNFYKRDDLVQAIVQSRNYPIEHIDYALSQMVENKTEYVLDKYGRYGYLINKGDYYVFQPFEVTDNYASIYEREIPVDDKNTYLEMQLPMDKVTKEAAENDDIAAALNVTKSFDTIITDISNNVGGVFAINDNYNKFYEEINNASKLSVKKTNDLKQKYNIKSNSSDWYENVGIITNILKTKYQVTDNNITDFVVSHFLDVLPLTDHLTLVNKIYNHTEEKFKHDAYIKSYYNKLHFKKNEKKLIILPGYNKSILFIFDDTNEKWVEAKESETIRYTDEIRNKFTIPTTNINNIFGFMYPFKDNIIFRIKNLNHDKNNTGAACEKIGKVDILHRLKPLLQENPYKKQNWPKYDSVMLNALTKPNLCAFIECITRFYNLSNKSTDSNKNKYWFLNTTLALTNTIVNK